MHCAINELNSTPLFTAWSGRDERGKAAMKEVQKEWVEGERMPQTEMAVGGDKGLWESDGTEQLKG